LTLANYKVFVRRLEWRTGMKDNIEYNSLSQYRNLLQRVVKVNLGKPDEIKNGKYLLVGIIGNIKVFTDKMMNEMAIATLKDFNGEIGLVFFPKFWLQYKSRIKEDKVSALIINVNIANSGERRNFVVCGIQNINKLQQQTIFKQPNKRIVEALRKRNLNHHD